MVARGIQYKFSFFFAANKTKKLLDDPFLPFPKAHWNISPPTAFSAAFIVEAIIFKGSTEIYSSSVRTYATIATDRFSRLIKEVSHQLCSSSLENLLS